MNNEAHQGKGNILIVDDTPQNLRLLAGLLSKEGFEVRPVPNGRLALEAAFNDPPDLILLDINMPEMDGFETCERLKANETTRDIPVIFISALTETMDKVKAFSVGGVDYVTKPFQFEEVNARVNTHIALRRAQIELRRQFDALSELDRLKENLVHMIVHDLRSPLQGIMGFASILAMRSENLSEDQLKVINSLRENGARMNEMVTDLLDITRMEENRMPVEPARCDLREAAAEAVESLGSLAVDRGFVTAFPDEPVMVDCDPALMRRIIANLLGNAFKFTRREKEVRLELTVTEGAVRVAVVDQGPGIPPDYRDKIFAKFGQVEARQEGKKYSTGLGLTFAKMAVESHNSDIVLESEEGVGSTFRFDLPLAGE